MSLTTDLLDFEVDETNLPVRREQVRARIVMYPTMALASMLLAPLLVWLLWDVVAHGVLMFWLVFAYGAHAMELCQWWFHRASDVDIQDIRRWDKRFRLHTSVVAIAWGGGWVVMFVPGDLGYQALLICVAMGFSAGAVTINPVHRPSLFIYLTVLLSPLILRVAMENDRSHWILAAMLLIYFGFLLDSAIKLMRTFELSFRQRFEKEALLNALHEREQETAEALEKAEQANQAKSKFLATASHDLRQPLQALSLFSEALQEIAKEPETLHLAGQIGKSVASLVEMFDDLLDVSRLDAGIIHPRWQHFALNDLFDRLYVDFVPLAQAKGLLLELSCCNNDGDKQAHCDVVAYSDPFLLERMLRNLVSNAIRYTEYGKVTVQCQCLPDQIEIAVQDTGIGIRPELREQIFKEYYQVDNPHRDRRKGLGLGLAIVRRVEELMGYHVKVESMHGQGSTFRFTLKKGDPAMLARPFVITYSRQDISDKVIALVEDDADIRELTAETMRKWGCRVIAGQNVEIVLRELDETALMPDMLVCDYRLPDNQTALDVMRKMREFYGDLPTLVVTGDTAAETLQAIQKSGASLLHKPIATSRLRSTMFFAMQGTASA